MRRAVYGVAALATLAFLITLWGAAASSAGSVSISVTDLGYGPPGATFGYGVAINSSGVMIGSSITATGIQGWEWSQGGGFVLLDPGPLGGSTFPQDINDAGLIAGQAAPGDLNTDVAFWPSPGQLVDVGTYGNTAAYAGFLSGTSGYIAGEGAAAPGTPLNSIPPEAFRASVDGITQIGVLPGDDRSTAAAVNDSGAVVGYSENPSTLAVHAFLWTPANGITDLGGLGGRVSAPVGIDNGGAVYGISSLPGDQIQHMWRWTSVTGLVDVGTLGGPTININRVYPWGGIIGQGSTASGAEHAFTWDPANGFIDLGTLGGNDSDPIAMSSRGEVIGTSRTSAGTTHDFYWTQATGMVDIADASTLAINGMNANDQMVGSIMQPDGTRHVALITLNTGPQDSDGDGVADPIDTGAGTFADASLTPATTGSIVSTGGNTVLVDDAPAPDGVRITVSGTGSASSVLSVCGFTTLQLSPGADVTVTCGSVRVKVTSGQATLVFGGGLDLLTVPQGGDAKVSDLGGGSYSVQNFSGTVPVTITVNGTTNTIAPNTASAPVAAWKFVGFAQPVDNDVVFNVANAGRTIPLKWQILDANDNPVTTLTKVTVTAQALNGATGVASDVVEQYAAGSSGLQNLGGGNYQFNWSTPKSYAGTCKTLLLDIGDGVLHKALFSFK